MQAKRNCCAIVQARLGSTRLPGKVLKLLSGQPMLWHIINRLKHSKRVDEVFIATTTQAEDNQVEDFCIANHIHYYRGSSDDVLSRYYETAQQFSASLVIRITSDCPVLDPTVVDKMIEKFISLHQSKGVDYLSNSIVRTFPRGLDIEIFTFDALEKTHNEAKKDYEREHVTPYIYQNSDKFIIKNFANDKDYSFHRWTVDTDEDFKLIEEIYKALYGSKEIFLFEDILKLFEERPELIKINQHIEQKKLSAD